MVDDPVRIEEPIFGDAFDFLQSVAPEGMTPKLTIPSPSMVHYRGGTAAIDPAVYPDEDQFWDDLSAAYAQQVRMIAERGCRYLQLDDTSLAYLNDPEQRANVAAQGRDAEHQHERYIRQINAAIKDRPEGLSVTTHMCRGNYRSSWAASGGYDFVAEALFSELDVDGFFLEYDDERSGGFEPLRFVPEGKQVVLGLVTTKRPAAGEQGRPQAPHRRGREVRPPRAALPLPPVRLLLHRRGQRPHRGRGDRQAPPRRRDRPGGLGLTAERASSGCLKYAERALVAEYAERQSADQTCPLGTVRATTSARSAESGEGELLLDDAGEAVGDLLGLLGAGGLDHHAHQRLGAGGAEQHPAGVAELGLGLGDGGGEHEVLVGARLVDVGHVDQHLRQPGHHRAQLGERLSRWRPSGPARAAR